MRIAIHRAKGSFSDRWIAYCEREKIPFVAVDCWDSDIVSRLSPGDILFWHWTQDDLNALTFARHIITALEAKRVLVYPEMKSCWHYDDKVAQKYILDAIGAPAIPTYVFYEKKKALDWIETAAFPKVFKLRRGSGSVNVSLARGPAAARALVRTAFGAGFVPVAPYFSDVKTKMRGITVEKLLAKAKRAPSVLLSNLAGRARFPRERGYIYFQDFVPGNAWDTKAVVVGDRVFAYRRMVRPGDFRASGSMRPDYDRAKIAADVPRIAFETARKLGVRVVNFDFLVGENGRPLISEMSYCTPPGLMHGCLGYWDRELAWHPGQFWLEELIFEEFAGRAR